MRKRALGCLLLAVLLLFSLFPPGNIITRASVIEVDASGAEGSYTCIQNAIDNAKAGDTIFIHDGVYAENVIVDKRLTLQGDGRSNTVIDGGGTGNVVTIKADGATLTDVFIRNSGSGDHAGVLFDGVRHAVLTRCRLGNNYYGIRLFDADSVTIIENDIVNSTSAALHIASNCLDALIFHNNFADNGDNALDEGIDNQWYNATLQEGNYWDDYTGGDEDSDGIGDTNYPIPPSGSLTYDRYPLMQQYRGINILHLQAEPQIQEPGDSVNISCRLTSSAEVNHSYLNITMPNGTVLNTSLNRAGNTTNYYFNRSYDMKGTYNYTVWANDTNNNSVCSAEKIFVVAYKPTASFTYTPSDPTRLDTVAFDASNSSDPDGTIDNYTWSFGDGAAAYGETVGHRYNKNRTYTVTLTVTDDHGAWDTIQKDVIIRNIPPTADFWFSPGNATVGEPVSFYDDSTDPDGSIVDHGWSFGDGNTSSKDDPIHAYARDGTFTITLTVTDSDYDTDTVSREITVTDVEPPRIENVSAYPNPQEIQGRVNVTCRVTDDVSVTDVRANITGLDPGNDGITKNVSMQSSPGATWWYEAPYNTTGNYSVTIWAVDPIGNGNTSAPYTFKIFRPAMPPEIHAVNATPREQQYGFPVNISCNVSDNVALAAVGVNVTNPDGGSINVSMDPFRVDEDGNGIYFYNETYLSLGNYSYQVWAVDVNDYVTVSFVYNFSVVDTMPPQLDTLSVTPAVQQPNGTVNVSCIISDNLAVKNVSIRVTLANETVASKEMNASSLYFLARNYSQQGSYNVTIYAKDTQGNTAPFEEAFAITAFPIANFSYSPTEPTSRDTMTFTDMSNDADGHMVNWTWSFGDGNTSTMQHPSHSYATAGTYTVTLTVTDNDGATASASKDIEVQNVPPTANFTYAPAQPTDVDAVLFNASGSTDSDGTIDSYTWSFGDGNGSSGATTSYTYADNGTYQVTLTVTDDNGASDSLSRNITVDNVPPVADFIYNVNELTVGVLANTTDPDGHIVNWTWSFGDGATEYGNHSLTHSYDAAGSYTVTLVVVDDDGASHTMSISISVGVFLSANFSYGAEPVSGEPLAFYDNSSHAVTWHWSFGDGTASNETNPSHTYPIGHYYNVTLTVANGSENASVSKTVPVDTIIHIVKNEDNVVNYVPWLGEDMAASALAEQIGSDIMPEGSVVSRWNTTRGSFDSYVVGVSPPSYDFTIHPGDCIVLRVAQTGQYHIEVKS